MPDQQQHALKGIKQLFDSCEPLGEADRENILGNPSLAPEIVAEVRRLLAIADNEQQNEHQVDIIGEQIRDLSQSLRQDQRLGAYRIESEIGRGGMGIVFLAHRADGNYQQRVAIKIAPSFASEGELKHFHRERQILAKLQHPNIAVLLDGGETPEQRPYLVMEHIAGSTITEYCRDKQLDLRGILQLFLAVCDAVSFAHRHLIIHRDIKPENVLVTPDGQVKLLDFGISKVLHNEQKSNKTTLLTGLTPAYASPEQVRGEATTTATDIYGLGTLLYLLLSGTSPHPSDDISTEQIIRAICEVEPKPASRAITATGAVIKSQLLKGDIDNILAKALRKEPENRYRSVSELQKDVERFLRGDPVLATPPSFLYRAGKLFRRYPVASLLGISVFVAISAGLGASTHLASKLRNERDNLLAATEEIERQAHTAQRVTGLLTNMFSAASPENARGRTVNVDELLDTAVGNTRKSLENEPVVKAQLLKTLAQVKFNTGKYKDAATLQREAMAINSQEANESIQAADLSKLGDYLREAGEHDAAAESLRQAVKLLRDLEDKELLAKTQMRQGLLLLLQLGKPRQALEQLQAAQDIWSMEKARGGEHGINTRHHLAIAHYDIGDFASAARLEEAVLDEKIAFYGRSHPKTLAGFQFLGQCYMRVNRWSDAQDHLEHAYQIGREILSRDHIIFRHTARKYANLLRRLGYYQRAIDILTDLLTVDAQNEISTAHILNSRGYAYFEQGMFAESRKDLEKSNEIFARLLPDSSSISFLARSNLGEVMSVTGDLTSGVALIEKVRRLNIEQYGEDDYGVAASHYTLARIALRQGEQTNALQHLETAKEIQSKHYERNNPLRLDVDEVEAQIFVANGNLRGARSAYESLIQRLRSVFPKDAPIIAEQQSALGEILWRQGNRDEGISLILQSQSKLLPQLSPTSVHIDTLNARSNLAANL